MQHTITDDLNLLLAVLPPRVRETIAALEERGELLEIVLDLGRLPEGRFPDREGILSDVPITAEDLAYSVERVGGFGEGNRAGIEGLLHASRAPRDRRGAACGLS